MVDPEKKKKYDSTMEFDESIPANREYEDEEFIKEFGGVFARNSIFSEKKPVPEFGDMKTSINKVFRFYEFWEGFKSWRDFTVEDEYDLDQAENRYERRYMERENKRMKKDLLKNEKARIKRLVDLARSKDPRVIKYEKEESERIEKIREEKRLEKQKRKEEEERIKAEHLERVRQKAEKEAEEQRRKEEEVRLAKQMKKDRNDTIKTLVTKKIALPEYGEVFLDFFLGGMNEEEFSNVLEILQRDDPVDEMRVNFKEFVATVKERQNPSKKTDKPAQVPQKKALNLNKWSEEEIALLTKGILKYPAGLGSRWQKIQEYIGGTKTIHEVTEMAKELSIKNVRGEKNIKSAMEDALKAQKEVKVESPPKVAKVAETQSNGSSPTQKNGDVLPPVSQPSPVSAAAEWTQVQQKALEAAMKQFPATMDKKERWTKIAETVQGKSAKECIDRVKEIKEKLASKKT